MAFDEALAKKHTAPIDFTGRPIKGFVFVKPPGLKSKRQLHAWVSMGKTFVKALLIKKSKNRN